MKKVIYLPLLIFVLLFHFKQSSAQKADIILTNGKIFTSDTSKLYVQALAIKGNKILATGNNAAIEKLATSKTKKIDLKGKTVVPGFNYQHAHEPWGVKGIPLKYDYHDFDNWDGLSKMAVLDSIAKLLSRAKPGEWLAGFIGFKILGDTSMRRSLDSIAPNNPVFLSVFWGHGAVTNQKGLEAVELSDALKDPVGGWYVRNAEGKISTVHEHAQVPFWWTLGQIYPEDVIKEMKSIGKEQLEGGVTSTLYFSTGFPYSVTNDYFNKASLSQRIRIVYFVRTTPEGRQLSEWPMEVIHPAPMRTVSGIKYVINHFGPLNFSVDTLRKIIAEALATRRQLMMHISLDSAFTTILNLIKESGTAEQWRPLRVRIEHNMIGNPTEDQRKDLRDYGILIMHTPIYNQEGHLRSFLHDNIIVGIAPDGGYVNIFLNLAIITSQQTDPAENITMEQAVIAFTKTNAYAEFKEKEKGMLVKGMLADLAVLSQDIFTIPRQQLPATTSVLTMIDGKIVYQQVLK